MGVKENWDKVGDRYKRFIDDLHTNKKAYIGKTLAGQNEYITKVYISDMAAILRTAIDSTENVAKDVQDAVKREKTLFKPDDQFVWQSRIANGVIKYSSFPTDVIKAKYQEALENDLEEAELVEAIFETVAFRRAKDGRLMPADKAFLAEIKKNQDGRLSDETRAKQAELRDYIYFSRIAKDLLSRDYDQSTMNALIMAIRRADLLSLDDRSAANEMRLKYL